MVKRGSSASPAFTAARGLVQLSEPREYGCEIKMRDGIIPVYVEAATHPDDCFGIGVELRRGKAECLVDVRFGFCTSTKEILGEADESMSAGQIAIQRQRLLAFRDALSCAFRKYLHEAQNRVSRSVVRCEG
jgi:hypothetical protein